MSRVWALLLAAVLLVSGSTVLAQPVPPITAPIELKGMTFNVSLGGDPALENYYACVYPSAEISGTALIDEPVIGGDLAPGDYVLRLLRDDGYALLAEVAFTIVE